MLTQPVYRASVPVADVCLQAEAFLVRETTTVTLPRSRGLTQVSLSGTRIIVGRDVGDRQGAIA
jgi:hypothetical protein